MEKPEYFKVVRSVYGGYFSTFARRNAQVPYSTDRWSTAPYSFSRLGYHLLVFDHFINALKFLADSTTPNSTMGLLSLWSVDVKGVVGKIPAMCSPGKVGSGLLEPISSPWPTGTVMVRKVKLVQQIFMWVDQTTINTICVSYKGQNYEASVS